MSVYVDHSKHGFGRMVMCHMIADTPDELRSMAEKIGVQLKWFQDRASVPHFDIALSKKAAAIAAGALLVDRREFVDVMKRIRQTWPIDNQGTPQWRWMLHSKLSSRRNDA